jgi:putative acetyltransferase
MRNPIAADRPDGHARPMEIREPVGPEVDEALEVVTAAFADEPVVVDVVRDLRTGGRAEVELVAMDGDAVVGHVMLSRCWVDDERRLVEALVLSPLGTRPEHEGRGVGTSLVSAALERARERGEPLVFLEGDPRFYGGRGFERASAHGFGRPSTRIPDAAFQVAVLGDTDARGRVVYPEAFWVHDATGLRGEVLAEVRAALGEAAAERGGPPSA